MVIFAFKYHSYGNDFLILPSGQLKEEELSKLSRLICHRHCGVGADGCIFLSVFSGEQYSLRIFNRDGSEAAMSGNGARCACAFLHHQELAVQSKVELATLSGIKAYQLIDKGSFFWRYHSWMGQPLFAPATIPFQASSTLDKVEEYPLEVAGKTVAITALSVGNPQCVVFVDHFPAGAEFEQMGTGLENHPLFPERTNVSFVRVVDVNHLEIRIWERGVGPTCSSGTGSCGAAVAAIMTQRVQSPVKVSTETGTQQVQWTTGKEIVLTGQVEFIGEVKYNWNG